MENGIVEMISQEEKAQARKIKRNLLLIWFACLSAYLILTGGLMIANFVQVHITRSRELKTLALTVSIIATVVFAAGSMFFFSIKFRLTRKYVRMLKDMDTGLKDTSVVKFLKYDFDTQSKDGVYFYSMVVDAKPIKREDISERKILIEHTIIPPEIYEGQKLKVVTHANILMSYQLTGDIIPPPEPPEETENELTEYSEE